mgnify:CR=1 FL=1
MAARAETPTHYITMGLNDDLNACATLRSARNDRFPGEGKTFIARRCVHAGQRRLRDLHITQLVDGQQRRAHDAAQEDFYWRIAPPETRIVREKSRRGVGAAAGGY